MKKRVPALLQTLLFLFLCAPLLVSTASADVGPKPSLTITVINAPEGELYLDLLAEGEPWENIRERSEEEYDPVILARLRTLEGDGWVLSCSSGLADSNSPHGDLRPRRNGKWVFDYWLPDSFRVAVATADHAQATQTAYTTEGFFTSLVYDWETNTVRPTVGHFFWKTLIPTLIIEGAVLWLFGFREKRTWCVFLAVNIVTQLFLHLFCNTALLMSGSSTMATLLLEAVIWAAEAAAFARLFRERSVKRRVVCALCANAASFLSGYLPYLLMYLSPYLLYLLYLLQMALLKK